MTWRRTSNRRLVEAIVDTFCESSEQFGLRLSTFRPEEWTRTEFWLDASGLALYFLDQVQTLGIEKVVDPSFIQKLEEKLADNKTRSVVMLEEFVGINRTFQQADISYANVKGFTLFPDSCPNSLLRHQLDFDFLVAPEQLGLCQSLLKERGYLRTGATNRTWEFKAGNDRTSSMKDHYKAKPQRSVELHIAIDETGPRNGERDPRLDRLSLWVCSEGIFPALSPADQLIGQALHILGHLRGESTRPSWLLEYRRHVTARREDIAFWHEVRLLASGYPPAATALGLCTFLATELFGMVSPSEFDAWTLDSLPSGVKLWAERYGREAVLADFPGTKLYLLLNSELECVKRVNLRRLLPMHRAPRVLHAGSRDTLLLRARRELVQLRFILFRLRFHLTQGMRYAVEAGRWKTLVRSRGSK